MKHTDSDIPDKVVQNFPIVGIGASAGGLDAFKKILKEIPENSGMAYVIVQHLSPDYDSRLTEILSEITPIPVHEIVSDINLAPNHIYIIPENHYLITTDGVLKLEKRSRNQSRNNTIDIFFKSLSEVHKSFAIGVILSGTAYDGTLGLKKIKEQGGSTIAQDPETAAFKGMPQSAIQADVVDFIVSPENIPAQLLKIQASYEVNDAYNEDLSFSAIEEETLNQIINVILLRSGNDFRHYKKPTLRRRIARRMVSLKKETLSNYLNALKNDKTEQDLLLNDLLIPVTYFFRDSTFFETLPRTVFPELIQNSTNNNLRIWIAGCATGEEAYSIAISLHEYLMEHNHAEIRVQIFASDISEKCITKARNAVYLPQDVQHISETRLQNYFTKHNGNYHISKVIRDMCVFAIHNFIKDPPFARIDLLCCRNVLIYFDSYLQAKVFNSFHYSLREKGFLCLGKSETAANVQNLFNPFEKTEKIYSKKFAPGRYIPEPYKSNLRSIAKIDAPDNKNIEPNFIKTATDVLFSRYTPAGVVVNEHLEIVHFHGDTSPFLLSSPGKPNFNILKMVREGIGFELKNAILKAVKNKETTVKENVAVQNQPYLVSFEVVLLDTTEHHIMILFTKKKLPEADIDSKHTQKTADQQRILDLENELSLLREDIKRVSEEQQTSFEEMQTSNEELLSSSEELQAMNEELETSTEELQSNNEELMCINDELMDRQAQLISLRNYAESIVNTIREPLVIIDQQMLIKSANPAFYKYFNTTERETEGFSLFDIGKCQWDIPEFKEFLYKMVNENGVIEDYKVETLCVGDIGKKTMMANARFIIEGKPPGIILLALEDITELIKSNSLLTEKNKVLESLNDQLEQFSSAASHDLQEPLRKVQMFCKRIIDTDKELSKSTKHSLERMLFSIVNMTQLVSDLISYTRIDFIEKAYKKTDLNSLLKKTIFHMKEVISEKKAQVTYSSLPELMVIPYQIQQLFTNLISNAVKYSKPNTPPEIEIRAEKAPAEEIKENYTGSFVKIVISDNGIGFDKEYEKLIFDPFYRLHTHEEYQGSGIGLTLSKKIVENHKGFITASSEINKGTTINLYFPLN